ncbi:hypothetical protein MM01_00069 [Escherichia phage vB_EcoS_MM01]|uniref:Uncharacterized protein n=1 Tax=Escherichia phage vB_EcoS_MM01 TaxID=2508188 RepID=A0A482N562_9CAUD|nr:hypothetical protein MM01_00069 [Escherichia phage vB_EcoS_MM01]
MKKLITAVYAAAILASGIGFAKASADTMTTTVNQIAYPTSAQFCSLGQEFFHDGAPLNAVIDALKESPIHNEDKLLVVQCFINEMKKHEDK